MPENSKKGCAQAPEKAISCEICNKNLFSLPTEIPKESEKSNRNAKSDTPLTKAAASLSSEPPANESSQTTASLSTEGNNDGEAPSTSTTTADTANSTVAATSKSTTTHASSSNANDSPSTISDQPKSTGDQSSSSTTTQKKKKPDTTAESKSLPQSQNAELSSSKTKRRGKKIQPPKLPMNKSNYGFQPYTYDENTGSYSAYPSHYDKLVRYRNHRSNATEYSFTVPKPKINIIANIIDKFMSYDPITEEEAAQEKYTVFMSMKEAEEYFTRKFHVFKNHTSIMQFKYPPALADYEPREYKANNDLVLNMRAVRSVYGTNYLSDDILSFCMQCLNYVIIEKSPTDNIPHVLFGSVNDASPLVMVEDDSRFDHVLQYISYGDNFGNLTQNLEEAEKRCAKGMKDWYCGSSKHYLSKILDNYAEKDQIITKYANILHVNRLHWILLVAEISSNEEKFVLCVYTMDGGKFPDNDAKNARIWFAKYFGLYVKEFYSGKQLEEEDFDCHDVIDTKINKYSKFIEDKIDRKKVSILKQEARPARIQQHDGYNCGPIGLINCIEMYRQTSEFHKLPPQDQYDALDRFRLNILSMVAAIYDELNGEIYSQFKDHLYFHEQTGSWASKDDLFKWDNVHSLFNVGTYMYSPEDEETVNANVVYLLLNDKEIEKNITVAFPSPPPKKKDPTPRKSLPMIGPKRKRKQSKDGKQTPAKKKKTDKSTPSSRQSARRAKNVSQTGFLDDVNQYSLIRKHLKHDFEHNRIRRVFDVSDTYLFLSDTAAENQIKTSPWEIVNQIAELFVSRYVSNREQQKDKRVARKFEKKVKDLMSKYKTYFVMDLVKDPADRKAPLKYSVCAAVIVEDDMELEYKPHLFVHMMAIDIGYDVFNHMKFLLYNMILGTKMESMNVVFQKTFGDRNYLMDDKKKWYDNINPETLLLNYGFSYQVDSPTLNAAIGDMIEPNSQIMYGNGEDIIKGTKKYSQFFEDDLYKDCRVLTTNDSVKFLLRYIREDKKFEMWNHTFLWKTCNSEMIDYVTKGDQKLCRDNPDKILIIKGGGHRDDSDGHIDKQQRVMVIDTEITSQSQKSENNCVWLSAILLIQFNEPKVADLMLELLDYDHTRYEWMYLAKCPKSKRNDPNSANLLIEALRHPGIQYTLTKVDISEHNYDYIGYLFKEETEGQYICQLETSGGDRKHVIAIDIDRNMILDACETHALRFNRENLDYVSGKKHLQTRKIVYCYQLHKRAFIEN